MAVVEVLHSGTAHNPLLMHLLRCFVFYAAVYHFSFTAAHVPGTHNGAADALPRNNLPLFALYSVDATSVHPPAGTGPPCGRQAQLGVTGVDKLVHTLVDHVVCTSTMSVYQSGWHQCTKFCVSLSIVPLPLNEHTLCRFVAVLSRMISWKSISTYLAAPRFFQIRAGLPDPSSLASPMS